LSVEYADASGNTNYFRMTKMSQSRLELLKSKVVRKSNYLSPPDQLEQVNVGIIAPDMTTSFQIARNLAEIGYPNYTILVGGSENDNSYFRIKLIVLKADNADFARNICKEIRSGQSKFDSRIPILTVRNSWNVGLAFEFLDMTEGLLFPPLMKRRFHRVLELINIREKHFRVCDEGIFPDNESYISKLREKYLYFE